MGQRRVSRTIVTDGVPVKNTHQRPRVHSDTCPHSARMCMQASCLGADADYESWIGDYEVALSDAPHPGPRPCGHKNERLFQYRKISVRRGLGRKLYKMMN